ncbi:cobalamin adenosyltransferase [Spiroplasma sabaudiense Ar-1343]|uniref:Cobalamin adenosyltransferase n=1 Tax=Spiroplasma sabaudiense Ar-1343 TaxID=1276257 RepID=W6A9D1_9MOLU|nr:cob(I)yrinic acid a,c-diamide adenosyltransferase [Spiroplasma sabaudiense]AHI53495.1 cobalamin adenosyltransferase [Spiroplasma sabaudiense Ar-1343]
MNQRVKLLFRLTIIPVYAAMVVGAKEALALVPNIELVTFLLSFAALVFPVLMVLGIITVFTFIEVFIYSYGVANWMLLYLVAWPMLVLIVLLLRKAIKWNWIIFVIINTLFGFAFGLIDATLNFFVWFNFDFPVTVAYYLRGITFDIIHGVGNCLISFILYKPVMLLWESHLKKYLGGIETMKQEKGYFHIIMGEGKGKTSALNGMALRAIGDGWNVKYVRFLKNRPTSENKVLKKAKIVVENYYHFSKKFIWEMDDAERVEFKAETQKGLDRLKKIFQDSNIDMVLIDEVLGAIENKLIDEDEFLLILKNRKPNIEVAISGRYASDNLIKYADLVSKIEPVKHYIDQNVESRKGIEY